MRAHERIGNSIIVPRPEMRQLLVEFNSAQQEFSHALEALLLYTQHVQALEAATGEHIERTHLGELLHRVATRQQLIGRILHIIIDEQPTPTGKVL